MAAVSAFGQDLPSPKNGGTRMKEPPRGTTLVVKVSGRLIPQVNRKNPLLLDVEPGPIATKGIRVYSEPSHVRLLLVGDNAFLRTAEGQAWWAQHEHETTLEIISTTTDLPDGHPSAQMSMRPATDDRISIWVYGPLPDGSQGEDFVADAGIGGGDFSTSIYSESNTLMPDGNYYHCCSCAPASDMICFYCSQRLYNCCVNQDGSFCALYCPPEECEFP